MNCKPAVIHALGCEPLEDHMEQVLWEAQEICWDGHPLTLVLRKPVLLVCPQEE